MAIIFCIGGLGLHAARDWHRHGAFGASFFHLHFHVGEHGHDHPAHDDHETPPDAKQQRTAVLTVAQAIHDDGSVAPAIAPREPVPDRTTIDSVVLPRSIQPTSLANPRAPPT